MPPLTRIGRRGEGRRFGPAAAKERSLRPSLVVACQTGGDTEPGLSAFVPASAALSSGGCEPPVAAEGQKAESV
jgi:hypothetical protein